MITFHRLNFNLKNSNYIPQSPLSDFVEKAMKLWGMK